MQLKPLLSMAKKVFHSELNFFEKKRKKSKKKQKNSKNFKKRTGHSLSNIIMFSIISQP